MESSKCKALTIEIVPFWVGEHWWITVFFKVGGFREILRRLDGESTSRVDCEGQGPFPLYPTFTAARNMQAIYFSTYETQWRSQHRGASYLALVTPRSSLCRKALPERPSVWFSVLSYFIRYSIIWLPLRHIKVKLSHFIEIALLGPADLTGCGLDKGIIPLPTRGHVLDREKNFRWKLPIRGMTPYPYNRMAVDTARPEQYSSGWNGNLCSEYQYLFRRVFQYKVLRKSWLPVSASAPGSRQQLYPPRILPSFSKWGLSSFP